MPGQLTAESSDSGVDWCSDSFNRHRCTLYCLTTLMYHRSRIATTKDFTEQDKIFKILDSYIYQAPLVDPGKTAISFSVYFKNIRKFIYSVFRIRSSGIFGFGISRFSVPDLVNIAPNYPENKPKTHPAHR